MHLKIFGYTLMLKELNIENNFHKQKITVQFPSLMVTTQTDSSSNGGKHDSNPH